MPETKRGAGIVSDLFSPETLPFAVAIGLMALLVLVEAIGTVLGGSLSHVLDAKDAHGGAHLHVDGAHGVFGALLDWLCVGRVPLLVLLIVFLAGFGATGLALQGVLKSLLGQALHPLLASGAAFAAALPITRAGGLLFAKIMPRDQTEAVSRDSFVGQTALVTSGTARRGLPAEAKLRDAFGQTHWLRIEPDDEAATLTEGTRVLIVRRAGHVFHAIAQSAAPR